jgi:hypothetical protein
MSIRDDDNNEIDPPASGNDPGEGFNTGDEIAGDAPPAPSDGFEIEVSLEAKTVESFEQLGAADRRTSDGDGDDAPPEPGPPTEEPPGEGFGVEHEIKAPGPPEPPPSEGFGQERET